MLQNQHFAWLLLIATGVASSQTFEVASVRPSKSTSGRFTMNGGPGTSDPGRISYTNIMLKRILLTAYDLPNYRISGPDWLDTLRFDITATVPDGSTKEQFQSMLRNLLATRFQMTVHRESKEMAIYALLVAKNGAKVKRDGEVDGKPAEEQLAVMQRAEGERRLSRSLVAGARPDRRDEKWKGTRDGQRPAHGEVRRRADGTSRPSRFRNDRAGWEL
jgi:uncharacterized protein (TIGR03435 family)